MAMKASDRRAALRIVQSLVNELIAVNESVYRYTVVAEKTDALDAEIVTKCQAIMDGAGISTTTDDTGATISDIVVGILHGNTVIDSLSASLDWLHTIEG